MCVNYSPVKRRGLDFFDAKMDFEAEWRDDVWQDYAAPIIVPGPQGERQVRMATYGMKPKRKFAEGEKHYSTLNARSETVGQLRTYSKAWKASQLCLVPMERFFEPNWETGKNVWWGIGMADASPFAVAGLWRSWEEPDGDVSHSFTQLTINADGHPLMSRFHRPGHEKRSLVIVPQADYDDWLTCRNPELARLFLNPYPAHLMRGEPVPKQAATAEPQTQPTLL